MLPRASVSAARVAEVIDTEPEIADPKTPATLALEAGALPGTVVFDDVEFMYEGADEPVLQHISFTAKPGETVAIIGATGSGKSTILNLLPRFYDVSKGSISIDGVDIRELGQRELRENIGLVSQKAQLFSGTIASNMELGLPGGSDDEFLRALGLAQAAELVEGGADGLEAPVSQSGANLSGGQKQRLAIARALAKDAPILIFDDSFSALDFKTDALLRQALSREMSEKTVLIVAQRVGTIRHADRIIVLDKGRIVASGTHGELMSSCEEYREIAMSQLSKEELQ